MKISNQSTDPNVSIENGNISHEIFLGEVIRKLNQRSSLNYFLNLAQFTEEQYQHELLENLRQISNYNPNYVKLFLKKYLTIFDNNQNLVLIDDLYEFYTSHDILNASSDYTKNDRLVYKFPQFDLSINEVPNLILGNLTTGFRTWEAAIFLADYLINRQNLKNSSILELGCGTGLVGLALKKSGNCKNLILTDGSNQVVDNLSSTLAINNLSDNSSITCKQFLWDLSPVFPVDYIIGADITYDSSILDALIGTIDQFFNLGTKTAYISATIRNIDTINDWEDKLELKFEYKVIEVCKKPEELVSWYWYRPGTPDIRVYEIKRREIIFNSA